MLKDKLPEFKSSVLEVMRQPLEDREIQTLRFSDNEKVHYNAQMKVNQIRKYCELNEASKILLKTAMENLNLSARAYDWILKVSIKIADLESAETILSEHSPK